jgi:predicted O-methyltransferase YrrM
VGSPQGGVVIDEATLRGWVEESPSRVELWTRFVGAAGARSVAEIGVYRGDFAARLLDGCPAIETYYMVDPWRHLEDWNKPANKADDVFERFYAETMDKTSAHEAKRVVLRGKTSEVAERLPEAGLDFAYVDGDHTLRGVTVDLVQLYPKVRDGGWIGGDDFCRNIWQHKGAYEPTMVFPYAVYFAEAVGARIYALPHRQFALQKGAPGGHAFVDLTGRYDDLGLRRQMRRRLPQAAPEPEPAGRTLADRVKRRLAR